MIVAIDGPAGSGKSTTARRVAEQMGWLYLDTGAMYRAIGLAFQDAGRDFTPSAAEELLPGLALDMRHGDDGIRVFLGGNDVSDRIRTAAAGEAASRVSTLPAVRQHLLEQQRSLARRAVQEGRGAVLEGRDIGTVVFPEADVKVFLVADPAERARRRQRELARRGEARTIEEVTTEIVDRDRRDRERDVAPLRKADDAVELDTTSLTFEDQVQEVLSMINQRIVEHPTA